MSREFIDAIASGNNLEAEDEFKNSISSKVGDALEFRRKELSQNFAGNNEVDEGIMIKLKPPPKNPAQSAAGAAKTMDVTDRAFAQQKSTADTERKTQRQMAQGKKSLDRKKAGEAAKSFGGGSPALSPKKADAGPRPGPSVPARAASKPKKRPKDVWA